MSEKSYTLLHDLPDYKAGQIFTWHEGLVYYCAADKDARGEIGKWPARFVENNPEWFEPVQKVEVTYASSDNLFIQRSDGQWMKDDLSRVAAVLNGEMIRKDRVEGITDEEMQDKLKNITGYRYSLTSFCEWLRDRLLNGKQ